MSKIHHLKGRIRSVAKVGQITQAMEKVAASKMRRAQAATLRSRTYAASAWEILQHVRQLTGAKDHPLFAKRVTGKRLLVVITSDRGLAGAYNSSVFKVVLEELKRDPVVPEALVVGRKGAEFLGRLGKAVEIVGAYTDWPAEPTVVDVQPLVKTALTSFTESRVQEVRLIYTDFVSMTKQQVVHRVLLPLAAPERHVRQSIREAIFEPSPHAVLEYVVPRVLEVQVYQAVLEAVASEHSMRMVAMKNASDNANEISDVLNLVYNRARQGVITQELAEITAGAEAVN